MKIIKNEKTEQHIPTFLKIKNINKQRKIQMQNSLQSQLSFNDILAKKQQKKIDSLQLNINILNPDHNLKALVISFLHLISYQLLNCKEVSNLFFEINSFINSKENQGIIEQIKNKFGSNLPTESIKAILKCSLRILLKNVKKQSQTNHNSFQSHQQKNKVIEEYFSNYSLTLGLFVIFLRSVLYKVGFTKALNCQQKLETKEIYYILCEYFGVKVQQYDRCYVLDDKIIINESNNFQITQKQKYQKQQADVSQCLNYSFHSKKIGNSERISQIQSQKNNSLSMIESKITQRKCFNCKKRFKQQKFCRNLQLTIFPTSQANQCKLRLSTEAQEKSTIQTYKLVFKQRNSLKNKKHLTITDGRSKTLLRSLNYNNSQIKLRIKI